MPLDLLFPFTLPRLFWNPAISNFFPFPLGLGNSGVRLYTFNNFEFIILLISFSLIVWHWILFTGGGGILREWEIVDTCEVHIEYFMESARLLTYQNHWTSEHFEWVRFLVQKQWLHNPYRALFLWYCVYYIHSHSEKLFILPAVYLRFFQNGKICHYTSWK